MPAPSQRALLADDLREVRAGLDADPHHPSDAALLAVAVDAVRAGAASLRRLRGLVRLHDGSLVRVTRDAAWTP